MSDRLWAPWRMEYITGRPTEGGRCIFCDFAAAPPATYRLQLVLIVQPHALVCLNKYPFTSSHVLVAPTRHVSDVGDLPPDEYDAAMRLLRDTIARVRRATGAEAFNIGPNLGTAAGAGIADHLHAHVVPRWIGDSNFMPVVADVRVMPEYLDESWLRLAPFFADVPGQHPLDAP